MALALPCSAAGQGEQVPLSPLLPREPKHPTLRCQTAILAVSGIANSGAPMPAEGHAHAGKGGNPLDLAAIGNCRIAALLDARGRIVWWCFPRFDADPVFSRLLAGHEEKGFCDVVMEGAVTWEAGYLRNTAIVETTIRDASGNAFRITDLTPRFKRFERVFRSEER